MNWNECFVETTRFRDKIIALPVVLYVHLPIINNITVHNVFSLAACTHGFNRGIFAQSLARLGREI